MIYFVTQKKEKYISLINKDIFKDIIVLDEEEGLNMFFTLFKKKKMLSVDLEATGLDSYKSSPLLYGIGTKHNQIMLDATVNAYPYIEYIYLKRITILGHNLQYDLKLISVNTGIMLRKIYDTMIAEQRIWMKSGYTWGYADLIERYLKKAIIKSVRNEFIGADPNTFEINPTHLYYLRTDLTDLYDIRVIQRHYIKRQKMELLIYGIEFPLTSMLADAELEGFVFDVDRWRARIEKEKDEKFSIEVEMDKILRELRDFKSHHQLYKKHDPKLFLSTGKYDNSRKNNPLYDIFKEDGTTTELNLFGEVASHKDITRVKKKVDLSPNNIKWNNKKEIVFIFAALEEPLCTTTDSYIIPRLNEKGKILQSLNDFTIEIDALEKYMLLKPDSIMIPLIKLKIKHSQLTKSLSTYGENFVNKIHPMTGKIHTCFRQCFAETGRMQSGGGKKEPDKYNAQNIPAQEEYRKSFTVNTEKYRLVTADYSGAELIVMASHAQDFKLIDISRQDMHSFMAQKCWRNIFAYRASQLLKLFNKNITAKTTKLVEEYNKNVDLFKTFEVNKNTNKEKRGEFKPMTFGVIYGMYAKKAGATLNIPKEEGQVVIDTISREIPQTINMVKMASIEAETRGFVILNNRTNSRAWFPNLIRQLRGQISKDTHFLDISNELSAARNIRIQGTQADFVKEASVVLMNYFWKNRIDAKILSWVHDEVVVRIPVELDGKSDEYLKLKEMKEDQKLIPSFNGKTTENLPDMIRHIMIDTANKYLHNVEIDAEIKTEPYWIK